MSTTEKAQEMKDFSKFIRNIINPDYEGLYKEEALFRILFINCKGGDKISNLKLVFILGEEGLLDEINIIEKAVNFLGNTYINSGEEKIKLIDNIKILGDEIIYRISKKAYNQIWSLVNNWSFCEICSRPTLKNQLTECENCGKWYCKDCEEDCYRCIECWDSILILPEEEEGEE